MSSVVSAVIGVPAYNGAKHLPEALESLLSQTHRDTAFVVVDDGSSDETAEVVGRYANLDPRVSYERNPHRLGMIGNWRLAFEQARTKYPDARYFAWASDHDVWHPFWLERLVGELDANPESVLAYPLSLRISESGETIRGPWYFDTALMTTRGERFRATLRDAASGSMVYGLFRVDALARAGVFRTVIAPDRLLLVELSLQGAFRQVDATLWYRRFAHTVTNERQRQAFFPDGTPAHAYVPWWLTHPAILAWNLAARGSGKPQVGRLAGLSYAGRYLIGASARSLRRRKARTLKRFRGTHLPGRPNMRRLGLLRAAVRTEATGAAGRRRR